MTDRELLELAAKAEGIEIEYREASRQWVGGQKKPTILSWSGPYLKGTDAAWNPLTDDSDALRLAVKLGMDVCFGANYVIVRGIVQAPIVNNANDPYAATRRAIVRAAAEIGKLERRVINAYSR